MQNANKPDPSDLPSTRQLLKSTGIAVVVASALLVTVVLPAEYGIDPTRVGSLFGLTEMGRIKVQLAAEAKAEEAGITTGTVASQPASPLAVTNDQPTAPTLEPAVPPTPKSASIIRISTCRSLAAPSWRAMSFGRRSVCTPYPHRFFKAAAGSSCAATAWFTETALCPATLSSD